MADEQRRPSKDVAEAKTYIKRDLGTWLSMLDNAKGRLQNLVKDAEKRETNLQEHAEMYEGDEDISPEEILGMLTQTTLSACRGAITSLENIHREMSVVQADFANLGDVLEVMKADADYKAVVVDAWPKSVFADRMTYLGTALLGAGSGTYAIFGTPLELGPSLVPALVLWGIGLALLLAGLFGVRERERLKWDFFTERFDVPK